ncbi:g2037 [Coccomyxa viridis]|uniref:phosphoribosylaminoimidazole carboxylase n=1 Tax=Coccomyxa viridis TaxID=1274662 RepID=A0ABP1FMC8_9CHLO
MPRESRCCGQAQAAPLPTQRVRYGPYSPTFTYRSLKRPSNPYYLHDKRRTSASAGNGSGPAAGLESSIVDETVIALLESVRMGQLAPAAAAMQLRERSAGYQQVLEFAQVDSWRAQRTGFPEVVLGAGKSAEQIAAIMRQLAQNEQVVMATRVSPQVYTEVLPLLPEVQYNARARILMLRASGSRKQPRLPGTVAIISAGTSDEQVAEECRATADAMGCYSFRLADVSVDGLHRILHNLPAVRAADVIVVVAGTDGALPSVVAGLVEAPVIAVPTSVGYGAALQGITPLLAALTASSPGVSVVNIDNGFGAGMLAARILKTAARLRAQALAAAAPAASAPAS